MTSALTLSEGLISGVGALSQGGNFQISEHLRKLNLFRVLLEILWYYQCSNPTIVVRQHDQGASNHPGIVLDQVPYELRQRKPDKTFALGPKMKIQLNILKIALCELN